MSLRLSSEAAIQHGNIFCPYVIRSSLVAVKAELTSFNLLT
jgi:hypothetical protein